MSPVSSLRRSSSHTHNAVCHRNCVFRNIVNERKEAFIPLPCSSNVSENDAFKKNQKCKEEELSTSLTSKKSIQKRGKMFSSSSCSNISFNSNIINAKTNTGKLFSCSICSFKRFW